MCRSCRRSPTRWASEGAGRGGASGMTCFLGERVGGAPGSLIWRDRAMASTCRLLVALRVQCSYFVEYTRCFQCLIACD